MTLSGACAVVFVGLRRVKYHSSRGQTLRIPNYPATATCNVPPGLDGGTVTETLSDVLTSPIVIAIARLDGTGEVHVDGVSHAIQAASADAARQDCFGYIFHDVVQNLGRPVRVEARDSEATRFLVLHPSGEVTADEDPSPPHPDLLTPPVAPTPAPATWASVDASAAPAPNPATAPAPVARPAPAAVAPAPAAPVVPAPIAGVAPAASGAEAALALPGAHAARVPTLQDLLSGRAAPKSGPAMSGWRAGVEPLAVV